MESRFAIVTHMLLKLNMFGNQDGTRVFVIVTMVIASGQVLLGNYKACMVTLPALVAK